MANFDYIGNVKYVDNSNTFIELYFTTHNGVLEDDITAINVTGPSGLISDNKAAFTFFEDLKYIRLILSDQAPDFGSYNFSVTIDGETVEKSDTQTINRSVPVVLTSGMNPAEDAALSAGDINFTWGAVDDPGYTVYYGIQVYDIDGTEYVVNERYIGDFEYTENLSAGNYKWRVTTVDGSVWVDVNNRTNSPWIPFIVS